MYTKVVNEMVIFFTSLRREVLDVRKSTAKPLDEQGRKHCPGCDTYKAFHLFGTQKNRIYGLSCFCKDCISQKTRAKYTQLGSEYFREKHLIKTYGISLEEYNVLLQKQNGVCAICKKPETRKAGRNRKDIDTVVTGENYLHVDHCHKTGKIRGLLCSACNQALGLLEEDASRITSLLDYIKTDITG